MSAVIIGRVVVITVAAVAAAIAYVKYRNDQRQQHQHHQGSRGGRPPPPDDNDGPHHKKRGGGGSSWESDQDDADMVRNRTKSSCSEEKGCPICLESYSRLTRREVPLITTTCGHVFCSKCLQECLSMSRLCPFCRVEMDSSKCHQIFL